MIEYQVLDETSVWQCHRAMSPREFSRTIARLGMSQAGAGRYLGVSERTAYRYAKGETDIPAAQVLLLRALVALDIKPLVPRWTRREWRDGDTSSEASVQDR